MIVTINVWDSYILKTLDNIKQNLNQIQAIYVLGVLEFDYHLLNGSPAPIDALVNISYEHDIPLCIFTASHSSRKPYFDFTLEKYRNVRLIYWPTFWLTLTYNRLNYPSNLEGNSKIGLNVNDWTTAKNLQYFMFPFIAMNNRPKRHRCTMMDMLAKHGIIDYGAVIWRNMSDGYQFNYWDEHTKFLDQREVFVSQEIVPTEYALSFMQLVPETHDETFGLSEKTAIPLFFNKPFLVAGSMGFHKTLESLGFVLYDELFDYSFDLEPNLSTRYDMLASIIRGYTLKSKEELKYCYLQVFDKLVYNKKHALKLAVDIESFPIEWNNLAKYQMENNIADLPADINNCIDSIRNAATRL